MADSKVPTTTRPPLKTPPIPNIEAPYPNEKVYQYQQRIIQAQINRGSRYPPFSVEPLAWERMRLSKPMTDADRFLRKQWLQDQALAHGEPVAAPLGDMRCRARRLWGLPMDLVANAVEKVAGTKTAGLFRMAFPKFLTAYALAIASFYYIQYSPRSWEGDYGISISCTKRANVDDFKTVLTEPAFCDANFSQKKVNIKTSAQQ